MTFCLGVKVASGLVAIADTRLTAGTEVSMSKKLSVHKVKAGTFFVMTSGLRSVRDKTLTYFEEYLENQGDSLDKIYKAVNAFGDRLRQVATEDRFALQNSGLSFNLHTIIGGQLERDGEHKLYLIYPEGNWVEITDGAQFVIIGNSGYGKPILYRNIKYDTPLPEVLKLGFLAFDSTRVSASDVDFPIDVYCLDVVNNTAVEHRYEKADLESISKQWNKLLNESVKKLSTDWMDPIFKDSF
jgi:putative proteasome-type protease